MVHGPATGLRLVESLYDRLRGHYRLDAVRAHLFEMAGDVAAVKHYRAAASRTTSMLEQRYLTTRAARLRTAR